MGKYLKHFTLLLTIGAIVLVGIAVCCAEEASWQQKLLQAEGVISVEPIPLDASAQFFEEKYLVTFEQPLDWSDPDAGTAEEQGDAPAQL